MKAADIDKSKTWIDRWGNKWQHDGQQWLVNLAAKRDTWIPVKPSYRLDGPFKVLEDQ